ncbi:nucleotidyltransferase family protein [Paenibacillus sp. S150]|uniref:nucleotidyltransferase domain-containing protein n=1 Tax=Paenibacillus sp. S150 TaxID=2749826 RepID=UPI001C57E308|nr:nucleotidyltransferase family protein [Paenibacillus sp. S150]MBW4082050.1 nucleotidyltransferase family protein [Paenibacillus sp. S150]
MTDGYALDKKSLSKELMLLLAVLKTDDIDETAERNPQMFADIDWELWVRLSLHHRVFPYIYPKLSRMHEEHVPAGVTQRLKWEYRKNTVQMLQLSGEMGYIGEELAKQNIRSLFLKGPVLAQELYGDISLRTSRDLDFLVPMEQLAEAEALLVRLGYIKEEDFESILGDWKWREHHTTFNHPAKGIKAEVHWRLSPGPSREPGFDELWRRARTSSHFGRNVHYLGSEDLFLFLVAHGSRHGWSRLRWLLDIKLLLLQKPDSGKLSGLLQRYNYADAGGQALLLAADLLEAPVEPALAGLAERPKARRIARLALFYVARMVNLHNPPLEPEVKRHYKYYQPAILTPWHQLLYVIGFLYPYAADAKTLPLPKRLHVLYFPLRPFLWTWRRVRGGTK